MQSQQRGTTRNRQQRSWNSAIAPGTLFTAISIGAVVLIVAFTFFADWFQVPQLSASGASQYLSPNGDGNADAFTLSFHLNDNFRVTVHVLSEQAVVRNLLEDSPSSAGDHFVTWDGRDNLGANVQDGIYIIEITAKGSLRSSTQSVQAQVDTQPPFLQLANLPDALRVSKPNFVLEGVTEPGAVVRLEGTSQPLSTDNTGHFRYSVTLLDGDNLFRLLAIDPAGNTTRMVRTVSLVTQAPEIELTRPLENEWTNNQMLTVEGRTLPNTTLTINQQPVRVGADGFFQYQLVLSEGDNILRIVAVNDVGIATTIERNVYLKTGALPIQVNIQDGVTVADLNLPIIGKVEPGSLLTVNGIPVTVSALGDFQITTPLTNGLNLITFEAHDQAGNATRLVRTVNFATTGTDGLTRLSRNMEQLPVLIVPAILVAVFLLGFIYLRQNRVSLSLSVDQHTFVPGLPGEDKALAILLDLSKTANVSLEVLDQSGFPRATILRNRRKIGRKHVFYWNGYDDHGRPLPPDDYTVQVEAGAPPLQVTSALQIRIERSGLTPARTPAQTQQGTVISSHRDR